MAKSADEYSGYSEESWRFTNGDFESCETYKSTTLLFGDDVIKKELSILLSIIVRISWLLHQKKQKDGHS